MIRYGMFVALVVFVVPLLFAQEQVPAGEDSSALAESPDISEESVREAVSKSVQLLEQASAGTAEKRVCFTSHGQAHPVLALDELVHDR